MSRKYERLGYCPTHLKVVPMVKNEEKINRFDPKYICITCREKQLKELRKRFTNAHSNRY